jgi:hypothetical protein
VSWATSACAMEQTPSKPHPAQPVIAVLTADNSVVTVSANSGIRQSVHLGPRPPAIRYVGRLMAWKASHIVVLLSADKTGFDQIGFVNLPTLRPIRVQTIPIPDVSYRSLALGSKSGNIYLFGNRVVGPDAGPLHGAPSDAVITVLDPTGSRVINNWIARKSDGRNWNVLAGAVSDDEHELFVSYHSPDTMGLDLFAVKPDGIDRCPSSQQPDSGCVRIHGDFQLFDEGLLAATGSPKILQIDAGGRVVSTFDTKLDDNNHLMEFVVNKGKTLYASGSCLYVPGLSELSLSTGKARLLQPNGGPVCGEKVILDGDLLALLRPKPDSVLFVTAANGIILGQVNMPSQPIDAVAIG